jgi:hypothetical protein
VVIYLREIQVKLGVVALHFESLTAELLPKVISLLDHRGQHPQIGKVKRIQRFYLESATDVRERDILVFIVKMS